MPRHLTSAACGALMTLVAACGSSVPPAGGDRKPSAEAVAASWEVTRALDPPLAVGNDAVAAATVHGRPWLFSFLGLESGRDYRAITTRAFALDVERGQWEALPAVPGRVGRLAATAQAIGERVYVFGGYEVAADGKETTSPATDIYVAGARRYARGAEQPVPLDDAVSGVWRDRLIYLVSGWSSRSSSPPTAATTSPATSLARPRVLKL